MAAARRRRRQCAADGPRRAASHTHTLTALCSRDMARSNLLLCFFCAISTVMAATPRGGGGSAGSHERWLQLLAGRATAGAADAPPDWFPRPVPVTLPIGGRDGGAVPLLIVPVPVPVSSPSGSQCEVQRNPSKGEERPAAAPRAPPPPAFDADEPPPPRLDDIVSSQQLVELFQSQVAPNPELPPLVIPDYTAGEEMTSAETGEQTGEHTDERGGAGRRRTRQVRIRRYQQPGQFVEGGTPPAPPVFERSLVLRGELTVPRAGYTEPYTVWWDARGGAARVDLHAGATSTFRLPLPDGRLQGIEMHVDRSGERDVRRCSVAAPRAADAGDRYPPGIPDLHNFSFAGYFDTETGRVERWTRVVSGASGELGAARGEALTFRHEMVVARAPDDRTATPLRYSVAVDSSVLGAHCDGYTHRYVQAREHDPDPAVFALDPAEACEDLQHAAPRDVVEPLREYTLPHRDPRHDDHYQRFKSEHRRRYLDDAEQAVRKTVLVHHTRFVDSGNRQGATARLKVNFLGDRLDAEAAQLSGVAEAPEVLGSEAFPHSREQLAASRGQLPRVFDWRERGAVTHVRNQGASCNSCWAFSVTAAVEGALFVKTRRLVPLSEQSIVDCSQPFNGHGCGRTWPSAAYDYTQERGLPALADYTAYQAKVLACRDAQVPPVTRISAHVNVTTHSVQALKVAIRRHAPTVVLIYSRAKSFQFYEKGVLYDDRCAKNLPEHAVTAVGWGRQRKETHFILKNSWSEVWGEGGFVRVQAAANTCGVLQRPSYPRLERADVQRLPPDN